MRATFNKIVRASYYYAANAAIAAYAALFSQSIPNTLSIIPIFKDNLMTF
jgi:hypothetical protein